MRVREEDKKDIKRQILENAQSNAPIQYFNRWKRSTLEKLWTWTVQSLLHLKVMNVVRDCRGGNTADYVLSECVLSKSETREAFKRNQEQFQSAHNNHEPKRKRSGSLQPDSRIYAPE